MLLSFQILSLDLGQSKSKEATSTTREFIVLEVVHPASRTKAKVNVTPLIIIIALSQTNKNSQVINTREFLEAS